MCNEMTFNVIEPFWFGTHFCITMQDTTEIRYDTQKGVGNRGGNILLGGEWRTHKIAKKMNYTFT